MISLSSALRSSMATEYGLAAMMRLGCIKIFTGPQPVDADAAETGTLIATITQGGVPFTPGQIPGGLVLTGGPVAGACMNLGDWVLNVTRSDAAGWWRFVWNGSDNGTASEYTPRIDGRVGEGLWLPDKNLLQGDSILITSFFFLIPPTSK